MHSISIRSEESRMSVQCRRKQNAKLTVCLCYLLFVVAVGKEVKTGGFLFLAAAAAA